MIARRKLDCPNCGGSLEVRAAGYTTTLACRYCGSLIDVASPEAKLIAAYNGAVAEMAIPLGARGMLGGVEWEAVGWQAREAAGQAWEEVLLFNPYAGYRWLVLDGEDWSFGRALVELPQQLSGGVAAFRGRKWEADDPPLAMTTTRVVGEFYWRVKVGETVTGTTFWSGDSQLSLERSGDEENWTLLDRVNPRDVRGAFGLGGDAGPRPGGPAPSPAGRSWAGEGDARVVMLAAVVTTMLAFMITVFLGSAETTAASGEVRVPVDATGKSTTIGPIEVTRAWAPVTITARSNDGFVNKWVDLDYHLVDRRTQQPVNASATVDHYEGVDSDGHWSEGSYSASTMIAGVPRGSYDLVVEADAHTWSQGSAPPDPLASDASTNSGSFTIGNGPAIAVTISAATGGHLWGNFWTLVVLALGPALLMVWWHNRGSE